MQKAFAFEIKQASEDGTFTGLASTYGNVDETGDIIEPGAFTKTLAASRTRPLLWMHKDPIGTVELADSSAGLLAKGRFSLAVQQAKDAHTLLRDGVVRGLSIGFETIKADRVGEIRHLQEIK